MEILERMEVLQSLLAVAGGEVEVRKLHKLAYLCQMAGDDLGQDFVFSLYSVYSSSLDLDITRAIQWGSVEEHGSGDSTIVCLSAESPQLVETGKGFTLVTQLANEPLRFLDLLSTVVYLGGVGYSGEELAKKLKEIKGDLGQFDELLWSLAENYFGINKIDERRKENVE